MYVEIVVGSSSRKFTGSGTSMRKAKQAAASLALNEVGFKQFKTKQSRVEVGEESSKAKVVGQIMARSQGEIMARSQGQIVARTQGEFMARSQGQIMARSQGEIMARTQGGGKTSRHGSRGQALLEQGRARESPISKSRAGRLEHPSEGQVAMIDEVEKMSNQVFEQQPLTRKCEQAKSLRRPFTQHNIALGATSENNEMSKGLFNGQRSALNAPNLDLVVGDTDDSGSFEDSDGSSEKGMVGSNFMSVVRQQEAEPCKAYGIGKIQSSSRKPLEKKDFAKQDAAERLCDDTSRIANVRPIMKAEK